MISSMMYTVTLGDWSTQTEVLLEEDLIKIWSIGQEDLLSSIKKNISGLEVIQQNALDAC